MSVLGADAGHAVDVSKESKVYCRVRSRTFISGALHLETARPPGWGEFLTKKGDDSLADRHVRQPTPSWQAGESSDHQASKEPL